jgi:hypothetical protein
VNARRAIPLAVLLVAAPLWVPVVVILLLARLFQEFVLYLLVWTMWIGRGRRRVLFVYSDSPSWKEHIERHILPKLPANTVVLNWSHRASWRSFDLAVMLFRCFGGDSEFNPIGLVFERFDLVEEFRFWQPFRDAKHGRPDALQRLEERFVKRAAG